MTPKGKRTGIVVGTFDDMVKALKKRDELRKKKGDDFIIEMKEIEF